MKRILLCEFYQETNSFNPIKIDIEVFKTIRLLEGLEFYEACRKMKASSACGLIDSIEAGGAKVVPAISMYGCARGPVTDRAFKYFISRLEFYLENEEYDAVFCSLHGASVAENNPDVSGDILALIRRHVGPKMIVSACFDMHANITANIRKNCNVICGYRTYPHIDLYETGYRAGKLGLDLMAGKEFHQAIVPVPVLCPPSGYTTNTEPFKSVVSIGDDALENNSIIDYSVFNVQPWMDVPELSSSVVVVAEDQDTAVEKAMQIAQRFIDARTEMTPDLESVDAIIDYAEQPGVKKPVILCDAADSPNGGSVGDCVCHAIRLKERGSKLSMCLFVKDPEAVRQAFEIGVTGEGFFSIGAKYSPGMDKSLEGKGRVVSLHDGWWRMECPSGKGSDIFIGKTAVITMDNITILVCENPIESGDPQFFRHFGIEPTFYDIVVVKANTSFKNIYSKFSGKIIYADTPAVGAANLKHFKWKNIPKGLYPFDFPENYCLKESEVYSS